MIALSPYLRGPQDIVFYHRPSKTLIEADVMFNLTDPEQAGGFTIVPSFASNKLNPFGAFHKKVVDGFAKFDKPYVQPVVASFRDG